MNPELTQWLIAHLIAGALLGIFCLAGSRLVKSASAAQRGALLGVFLAGMALLTPLQGIWWPQIDVPVLQATELTLEPVSEAPIEDQPDTVNPAVLASEPTPQPETRPSALPTIFLSIWLLGTVMLLSRFLLGAWLWRRLWAKARLTEKTADYELRVSEQTAVPMASGRQILMPVEWLQWPAEEKRAALEHERAHAQHRDGWMRGIAAIATALHWPSPLVWLAERRLRLAQEQRCDEAVLAGGVDAEVYGRLLMRCAQKLRQSNWHSLSPVVACMARPSQLAERIEHIASGVPGAPAARWRHVVMALLLVLAGLQALHIRLVAQESQPSDKELVSIEVKFIETSKALEMKGAKRVGEHQRVLPAGELNVILRAMMRDEETKTTSYPRMVTKMNQPVVVRSVVRREGVEATMEKIGTPQLDWGGTILELTPSNKAGKIKLTGEYGLSTQVNDSNADIPIYEGVRVRLEHATLIEQDTLVVGPVRRPVKKGESAPDLWLLITVSKMDVDSLSDHEIIEQRQMAPKAMRYQFKDAEVVDVLRFLAADAMLERFIIGELGQQPQTISFDLNVPPLDALLHVCEKSGLPLKKRGRYWVVAKPGAAMPMMVSGEEAKKLRSQKGQKYDFHKATAGDVLRFLATDAGISFYSLPDDHPKGQRLITFDVADSPFGVLEAVCGCLELELHLERGIWYIRDASRAQRKSESPVKAEEPTKSSAAAQQYDFSKANLKDVLHFLATDAGIEKLALPPSDPALTTTVTFSIHAAPRDALKALCEANGLRVTAQGENGTVERVETWSEQKREQGAAKPTEEARPKSTSVDSTHGTDYEKVRDTLLQLPAGGRKLDENGKITSLMLGDMVLQPGSILSHFLPGQKGNMRVLRIEKDHIVFSWTEPNSVLPARQLVVSLKQE